MSQDQSHPVVRLATGRELHANDGYIGINDRHEIAEGYDGSLPHVSRPPWMNDAEWAEADALTSAEQIELAEIMIRRWEVFRDRAVAAMARGQDEPRSGNQG